MGPFRTKTQSNLAASRCTRPEAPPAGGRKLSFRNDEKSLGKGLSRALARGRRHDQGGVAFSRAAAGRGYERRRRSTGADLTPVRSIGSTGPIEERRRFLGGTISFRGSESDAVQSRRRVGRNAKAICPGSSTGRRSSSRHDFANIHVRSDSEADGRSRARGRTDFARGRRRTETEDCQSRRDAQDFRRTIHRNLLNS